MPGSAWGDGSPTCHRMVERHVSRIHVRSAGAGIAGHGRPCVFNRGHVAVVPPTVAVATLSGSRGRSRLVVLICRTGRSCSARVRLSPTSCRAMPDRAVCLPTPMLKPTALQLAESKAVARRPSPGWRALYPISSRYIASHPCVDTRRAPGAS